MLETIVAAVVGIMAMLGGKLWWANRKSRQLEDKLSSISVAEMAHVEKARLNLDAAKKAAEATTPDPNRRDFESDR
jgi:hypothetical protein